MKKINKTVFAQAVKNCNGGICVFSNKPFEAAHEDVQDSQDAGWVPPDILCIYLDFMTALSGPQFLSPPGLVPLCASLPLSDRSSLEAKAALSGHELLLAAQLFLCTYTMSHWKAHYCTEICFGLTELLCLLIIHNMDISAFQGAEISGNSLFQRELQSDSDLFWYIYELNLQALEPVNLAGKIWQAIPPHWSELPLTEWTLYYIQTRPVLVEPGL